MDLDFSWETGLVRASIALDIRAGTDVRAGDYDERGVVIEGEVPLGVEGGLV